MFNFCTTKQRQRKRFYTNDDKPAASVTVLLTELKKSAVADDDGKFLLHNIPAGNYTIEVWLVGYETLKQTINVQADKTININLQLKLSEKQLQDVIVTTTNKFKSTQSDYANKMPLSNLENAQSYSTITKDLIKDQVLFTVDDAMRNVNVCATKNSFTELPICILKRILKKIFGKNKREETLVIGIDFSSKKALPSQENNTKQLRRLLWQSSGLMSSFGGLPPVGQPPE